MSDDTLTLTVGGNSLSGWTEIEVVRGVEICPSIFSIAMTEKFGADSPNLVVQPGDKCVVAIGGDPVITGYVDRLIPSITRRDHRIQIVGRSKSADFVDCSAEWPGNQIKGSSVLEIATKLAKPYKITVEGLVDTGKPFQTIILNVTDTPYGIVEPLARQRGLLIYDLPNGNLALAQAGKDHMPTGFKQGQNIQYAQAEYSMDQRFSEYEGYSSAIDTLQESGDSGWLIANVKDTGVKRHRRRSIVAEAGDPGYDVLKKRAAWEAARRAGRSFKVTITTDSWRNGGIDGEKGMLWTPNATVDIEAPSLKLPNEDWVISEVAFRLSNQGGTTADVTCMPKAAFMPEPPLLNPLPPDIEAALRAAGQ